LSTAKVGNTKQSMNKSDFIFFTFKPRLIKTRTGKLLVSTGNQSESQQYEMKLTHGHGQHGFRWKDIIRFSHSKLQGWMAYYGKFGQGMIKCVLFHFDQKLTR